VTESQATLRQFFSALVLNPLPRIVAKSVAGRRVTIDGAKGRAIRFDVVELGFVPATARPTQRIERQIDLAVRTAETSLTNPFETMRRGIEFMAGAVEETIGAIQEAPYDPAALKLDLFDDVVLTVESLIGPTWTMGSLDVQVKLLQVEPAPADAAFRIIATGIAFVAVLTPDDVVGLIKSRIGDGLSARVNPDGEILIDLDRLRGHASALCEIDVSAGSIVINVRRGVMLGREVPLPKRYHRSHELALEGLVPTISVSDVRWRRGRFEISGSVKSWQRLLTPDHIRSITSQLASGST